MCHNKTRQLMHVHSVISHSMSHVMTLTQTHFRSMATMVPST